MAQDYARFYKCALQVNPFSYSGQYQGQSHGLAEEAYNEAVVQRCVANDIAVVGIADHGTVAAVGNLRSVLEAAGRVVLPGFEIASSEKVHMVCLYPAGTSIDKLNQFLGALGLPAGAPQTSASTQTCLVIAKLVHEQGGFWFAAHATSANGLLRLNKDGGGLTHIWRDCQRVLAAQIPASIAEANLAERRILENKEPAYERDRPIALINAKDVKSPDDLDNPRTWSWFKMTAPSLEALSLACRDPESRVRLSAEINPAFYSRIERITFERGYLDGLDASISPGLNAVVGGRGTGKSSLIEAIRFAFNLKPLSEDAKRAHKGIIDNGFSKEKAGVRIQLISFRQNGERYTISRYYGEPPRVLSEDGTLTELTPLDVLPRIEVYGQNELLAIVQDDAAKARLIGRFLPEDESNVTLTEKVTAALSENRKTLNREEERLAETEAKLLQLPVLRDRQRSFQKLGLEAELKDIERREALKTYIGMCQWPETASVRNLVNDRCDGFGEFVLLG